MRSVTKVLFSLLILLLLSDLNNENIAVRFEIHNSFHGYNFITAKERRKYRSTSEKRSCVRLKRKYFHRNFNGRDKKNPVFILSGNSLRALSQMKDNTRTLTLCFE